MAYETGFAANEFELQEKLNAFILSISGWRKVTQAGDFDSVYFSNGEDGYKDIYIRSVAGLAENPAYAGAAQRDFGDGYVGFLNFFAYQFYPEGGDGYDGYGECGRLGPMLLHFRGPTTHQLWMQAIGSQGSGSNDNRRWVYLNNITRQEDGTSIEFSSFPGISTYVEFDGKRRLYYATNNDALGEWDFATGRGRMIDRRKPFQDTTAFGSAYYIDPKTREEWLWWATQDESFDYRGDSALSPSARAGSLFRWKVNAVQGQGYWQSGFTGPLWPPVGNGFGSTGGSMIWDGHNNLYVIRGEAPSGYLITGGETSDWAKYHIPTDSWIIFTDNSSPPSAELDVDWRGPGLPQTVNDADRSQFVWLDKKTTGYDYHRIYTIMAGNSNIYYINIDEDNGLPVGDWVSQGSMPSSVPDESWLFHNRLDRWWWRRGSNTQNLYTAKFKETGSLSWSLVDASYFPGTISETGSGVDWYVDGYISRVRTSLHEDTEYWFFGSKDHITVATKSVDANFDYKYTFCYMGSVTPFTSTSPAAKSTHVVYPGTNVQIGIKDSKGEFIVGQRMYIADVNEGGGGSYIGDVEGVERKYMPVEKFTITDVDPGVSITADEIKNYYTPEARISYDPQPVGVTMEGLDKIQMTNSINTTSSHGAYEPAFNIAKLETVREEVVNASGGDARRNLYALWPVLVLNQQTDDANLVGTEARGSLIGIFAVSGTGDLVSGDTIAIGSNTYIVLDVTSGKTTKYAFGPVT